MNNGLSSSEKLSLSFECLQIYHSLTFTWILYILEKCPSLGDDTYFSKLCSSEFPLRIFLQSFSFFISKNGWLDILTTIWFRITLSFFVPNIWISSSKFDIGFNIHEEISALSICCFVFSLIFFEKQIKVIAYKHQQFKDQKRE